MSHDDKIKHFFLILLAPSARPAARGTSAIVAVIVFIGCVPTLLDGRETDRDRSRSYTLTIDTFGGIRDSSGGCSTSCCSISLVRLWAFAEFLDFLFSLVLDSSYILGEQVCLFRCFERLIRNGINDEIIVLLVRVSRRRRNMVFRFLTILSAKRVKWYN